MASQEDEKSRGNKRKLSKTKKFKHLLSAAIMLEKNEKVAEILMSKVSKTIFLYFPRTHPFGAYPCGAFEIKPFDFFFVNEHLGM